jgi:hypothetical protein
MIGKLGVHTETHLKTKMWSKHSGLCKFISCRDQTLWLCATTYTPTHREIIDNTLLTKRERERDHTTRRLVFSCVPTWYQIVHSSHSRHREGYKLTVQDSFHHESRNHREWYDLYTPSFSVSRKQKR